MERRNFIISGSRCCIAAGLCTLLPESVFSAEKSSPQEIKHSCEERMEFASGWLERFMNVLDTNLEEKTRLNLMEENGKACATSYLKSIGRENPKVVAYDDFLKHVAASTDGTYQVDGRTLYMTYMSNYEGKPATESLCLCPFVENKPQNLSRTYCHCSVGYIKEIYSRLFGQPVKVELISSVLYGDKRCKFKIEMA
jgi:predicted hydrocarbon binding protein